MRGILGFSFQVMITTGILVTSLFGLGLDWRLISAISALFPVIFLLCMIYVPESPYYLVKKGQFEYGKLSSNLLFKNPFGVGELFDGKLCMYFNDCIRVRSESLNFVLQNKGIRLESC